MNRRHLMVARAAAIVLVLLGVIPTANLLTGGQEVVWWRGALLIWSAYGVVLLGLLWIVASRWGAALERTIDGVSSWIMRVPRRRFVGAVCAFTTTASVFVALYCYAGRAFTGDEMAMDWHARMLLAGRLAIPRPAHSEFFNIFGVTDRGQLWYSQFPIGAPTLHAIGLAIGAPWLVNPVLLGLAAWQLYRLVVRAVGEGTARAATLLFALSPFVLVLGSTQLGHTAVLLLTLTALAELAAWDEEDGVSRRRHAAGIGLAVGAIALFRPYDALLVALPVGIFQLARSYRSRERLLSIAVQGVAGALPIAILLWANARTTGSPLQFAYDAANGAAHRVGFHVDPNGEMHTPRRGLVYASGYLMRFNRFLFEWPIPGLVVVSAVLLSLRRATRWDSLLLGLLASFLAGYAAYWGTAFLDGPRFLFPIVPVLVLYAARLPEVAEGLRRPALRRWLVALVPACVLCAWVVPVSYTSVPGRLAGMREQRTKLKTDVTGMLRTERLTNALVLVREPWRGRLLARLRAIGVGQVEAERLASTLDACALQLALDATDGIAGDPAARREAVIARAAAAGRAIPAPGLPADNSLAFAAPPTVPRCRDELQLDTLGTMPFGIFLRDQRVAPTGRLDGAVVFARDLGARDTLLRAEFGDRRWYLYEPGASPGDRPTLIPVSVP